MPHRHLTTTALLIVVIVFYCAFLASPLVAQEKADLAKLAVQLKDKDAAVRRSAVESPGQLSDLAGVDLLITALGR